MPADINRRQREKLIFSASLCFLESYLSQAFRIDQTSSEQKYASIQLLEIVLPHLSDYPSFIWYVLLPNADCCTI